MPISARPAKNSSEGRTASRKVYPASKTSIGHILALIAKAANTLANVSEAEETQILKRKP